MARRTMGIPMDRTIHDPDMIRSGGQMEAELIRPIVHQELWWERCGVDVATHSSELVQPLLPSFISPSTLTNQGAWRPLRFMLSWV
jgi:hypothetical protein